MENSSEDNYQDTKYQQAGKVPQKYDEAFFLLKFVQLICEYVADVGPFIAVAEDLGMAIVTVAPDEKGLGLFDEECEHAEAECEHGRLYHG